MSPVVLRLTLKVMVTDPVPPASIPLTGGTTLDGSSCAPNLTISSDGDVAESSHPAIVAISGDNESYAFARKLDMLFDLAQWPTRGLSQQTVNSVPPGLTFVTHSGDAAVLARTARLQEALHAVGVAVQSRALESMPQGVLMLVVGPQSP